MLPRSTFRNLLLAGIALASPLPAQEQFLNLLWPPRGVFGREFFGGLPTSEGAFALDEGRLAVVCHRPFDNPYFRTYHIEGSNWIEDGRLLSGDRTPLAFSDGFGLSVDVDGDTVVAGWGPGALVFRRRSEHDWERTLVPRRDVPGEFYFGSFPDGIAVDGGWLAVATAWWSSQNSVYLFHFEQGTWVEKLRIADRSVHAVVLDGASLMLGARDAIYAFEFSLGAWRELPALPYPRDPRADPLGRVLPRVAVAGVRAAVRDRDFPRGLHLFERTAPGWTHEVDFEVAGTAALSMTEDHVFASGSARVCAFAHDGTRWSREPDIRPPPEMPLASDFGRLCAAAGSRLVLLARDVFGDNGLTSEFTHDKLSSGSAYTYSFDGKTRATLRALESQMVIGQGGAHTLLLDAGPENAGKAFFLAGSLAGTSPGFRYQGQRIPLNRRGDPYYPASLRMGRLDGAGRATVVVELPPIALDSELDDLRSRILHHVFVLWEPGRGITHISNVAPCALLGRLR